MTYPRFSAGLTETAIGPAAGAIADLGELMLKARDAGLSAEEEVRFGDVFNLATQNTPFVNLFYARPALDFLFVNSLRELASPGINRRIQRQRLKDYDQRPLTPTPLDPFGAF